MNLSMLNTWRVYRTTYPKSLLILLMIYLVAFFTYHLLTLAISPLPWFDETFFASMTVSYNTTRELNLIAAPFAYNGELLIYGPVYFWITSFFTKIFGFNIIAFRLSGVIFGLLSIITFCKVLNLSYPRKAAYLIILALTLDPLFNANMHSGRMDVVALFFALLSILVYQMAEAKSKRTSLWPFVLSGVIFATALLTTPRIGILLIAFGLCQLAKIRSVSNENLLRLAAFSVALVLIYFIWIFLSFGSVPSFIQYYTSFSEYLGGGYYSYPIQQLPLLLITCLSVIAGVFMSGKRFFSPLVLLSIVSIMLFYSIVYDTGQYSVIIIPFQYAIVGSATVVLYDRLFKNSRRSLSILKFNFLAAILMVNTSFFLLKVLTIYITSETRNPFYVSSFIKKYIPPKSKVLGDESHFYAVTTASSEFQYIHLFKEDLEREDYQRRIFNYDYIVWSDRLERDYPDLLDIYKNHSSIIKVASFRNNRNKNLRLAERALRSLNIPVDVSYNCIIYKRLK